MVNDEEDEHVSEPSVAREERSGPMSAAELDEFLAGKWLCKLACVKPDGWPYVIPLWYVWLDGNVYVIGRARAAWIAYVRNDPRVSLVIDEEAGQHRRVQLTGLARIAEGPAPLAGGTDLWRGVLANMTARYMADTRGQAYADLTAQRPRILVEVAPREIVTWHGEAWHPRYYRDRDSG
jgi:nitroimidazol reductase NimA-like FMN-containing flavoprotein (pyridoxamine 5'-phosphate oxidase superfamily)